MTPITRILWAAFVASAAVVAWLALDGSRARTPGEGSEVAAVGSGKSTGGAAPGKATPKALAVRAAPASPGSQGPDGEAGRDSDGDGSETDAGDSTGAAELAAAQSGEPEAPSIEPEKFIRDLLDLAAKGEIGALTSRMLPGAVHAFRDPLFAVAVGGEEARKRIQEAADQLHFSFEDAGDGLLRLKIDGPPGASPKTDLYLVPKDGDWELAAESDLEGPVADSERTSKRLQLLALCQSTFLVEDLGGAGRGYAGEARELAQALDRSGAYQGILDPAFVAAVDTGRPFEGYVFARVPMAGTDFGYCATPLTRGSGPAQTLIIDSQGRIWAKDLGGEPPPSQWPGPSPGEQGWEAR